MNEIDFEAKLRSDGYTEIETQDLTAAAGKGQQRASFLDPGPRSRWHLHRHAGQSTNYIQVRKKSSPSHRDTHTTNRSVQKVRACSLVVNTRKSEPSGALVKAGAERLRR